MQAFFIELSSVTLVIEWFFLTSIVLLFCRHSAQNLSNTSPTEAAHTSPSQGQTSHHPAVTHSQRGGGSHHHPTQTISTINIIKSEPASPQRDELVHSSSHHQLRPPSASGARNRPPSTGHPATAAMAPQQGHLSPNPLNTTQSSSSSPSENEYASSVKRLRVSSDGWSS